MLVSWLTLRLPSTEPMAPKAALEGAKMVTSDNPLTVETKLAVVRAEARDVRPAATAVAESEAGMVRTVSMTWITPPVNMMFCSKDQYFAIGIEL
jgi:hypothetical protein